ncbi:MAG: hypothetical protein B6U72_04745 [Candidatus Altiarchaeales archaeon ex4484_2]|nr:MAG: hypothetical protein B6U72_04745 [Candidatus Altiarchaeales archaeon ex4484_2]
MITLKIKDLDKLKKKVGKNNLLITCSNCPYWNYPRETVDEIADKLNAGIYNVDEICGREDITIDVVDYDSVLVFSCGAGTQIISKILDTEAIPVADTHPVGAKFGETIQTYCQACGNCILDQTAGLCPITRCPKGLLNGPCGGMQKGMCETGEQPCIWALIFQRMEKKHKLDDFLKINMPPVSGK